MDRAQIRVARNDDVGALADTARARDDARTQRYPQAIYPALAVHAFALTSMGRFDDGRKTLDEMVALRALQGQRLPFGGSSIPGSSSSMDCSMSSST